MNWTYIIIIGVGLAIDASCVCASNGLVYKPKIIDTMKMALTFGLFQGLMPLIGYYGSGAIDLKIFQYNYLLALIFLSFIGIKMIYESLEENKVCDNDMNAGSKKFTISILLVQGLSTSIDALSVGMTFYNYEQAFVIRAVLIFALITFIMSIGAVQIGIKIGTKLNAKAGIIGGIVLILLGIKIFMEAIMFK